MILVLMGCASKDQKEEAQLHLQIGSAHLSQGNYPQALRELLIAEKLDPKNPVVQNNLGLAYFVRERLQEAEVHLQRALALDPAYTEARNNLVRILIERTRYDEARKEIAVVLADLTFPTPEKAWFNNGLIEFYTQNYTEAKESFSKALNVSREDCETHNFYGRSLYELKQFDNAAKALDQAVRFCQKSQIDEPHYYSALTYYQMGQKSKAKARMQEVVQNYTSGKYTEKAKQMLRIMR